MGYPKQPKQTKTAKKKAAQPATPEQPVRVEVTGPNVPQYTPTPSMQHEINHVAGMDGVEQSLDWIARGISNLTSDERSISLTSGYNVDPIKLTLVHDDYDTDDTMSRLVTAFERIADSVSRLAGLNRPRLEAWHEQDEYEPRNKSIACDGGAPGPKNENLSG